jgi:hypothetical protein
VDVLSSWILVRPGDLDHSIHFTATFWDLPLTGSSALRIILGWCSSSAGLLEVSGHATGRGPATGHPGTGDRARGLVEMWIEDPDGIRIVLVEVPAGHPLRRDPR